MPLPMTTSFFGLSIISLRCPKRKAPHDTFPWRLCQFCRQLLRWLQDHANLLIRDECARGGPTVPICRGVGSAKPLRSENCGNNTELGRRVERFCWYRCIGTKEWLCDGRSFCPSHQKNGYPTFNLYG